MTTAPLEQELRKLVVGTNDQRRRVGQTLFHFYRTLIFWQEKGLGFAAVTQMWSAGGAQVFDSMAKTLRDLGPQEDDEVLRAFVAGFLRQLAEDLERGDHMQVSFLRWLEEGFPQLTGMMQQESATSRIYDTALADILSTLFVFCARTDREGLPRVLRAAAEKIS
jgi:hypothetical protein